MLVVHLKRFSYTRYSRDKLETPVEFDTHLDLSPYVLGAPPQSGSSGSAAHYTLYAVVNHYGSLGGGHYTAYARMPGGTGGPADNWHSFDDSHVSSIRADEVCSPAAYVLFYRRTSAATADAPDLVPQLHAAQVARREAAAAATAAAATTAAVASAQDQDTDMDQLYGPGPSAPHASANNLANMGSDTTRRDDGTGLIPPPKSQLASGASMDGDLMSGPHSPQRQESGMFAPGSVGTNSPGGGHGHVAGAALLQGAADALAEEMGLGDEPQGLGLLSGPKFGEDGEGDSAAASGGASDRDDLDALLEDGNNYFGEEAQGEELQEFGGDAPGTCQTWGEFLATNGADDLGVNGMAALPAADAPPAAKPSLAAAAAAAGRAAAAGVRGQDSGGDVSGGAAQSSGGVVAAALGAMAVEEAGGPGGAGGSGAGFESGAMEVDGRAQT